ncbi:MAG: putative transposase [Aureispira sp.]|jgi:putative transposase
MIGSNRGIDGNKKVNGRKRHILVDVTGKIYQTHIHAANFHDKYLVLINRHIFERLFFRHPSLFLVAIAVLFLIKMLRLTKKYLLPK